MASPMVEELLTLKKVDLMQVAIHYKVAEVKSTWRKSEMLKAIIQWLVEEDDVLPLDALRSMPGVSQENQDPAEKLRLKELELEIAKVELEKEQVLLRRGRESAEKREEIRQGQSGFDVAKHARLVPVFEEDDVEKYFLYFEKVAVSFDWPKEKWSHLLQSQLKGKARDAYSALSVEEAGKYDTVKAAILRSYELVPEAYRQQFRRLKVAESQTHLEFARQKEQLFERWSVSMNVKSLKDLREIILLEEFKRSVHVDVRTHLEEREVRTLSEAARIADDFVLTHKSTSKVLGKMKKGGKWHKNKSESNDKSEVKTQSKEKQKRLASENALHVTRQDISRPVVLC